MPLISWLARTWILSRLFGGGRRRRGGYGYRRQGRGGLFPFPHYSTRTRGGSRVSVSGCCLPIPLMLSVSALAGMRALLRR
ncbi:MAG: hypothetical protein QOK21_2932 [Solirubrobacteraceae bacterium]|jgi:hypothetical protein|nr:hypothetical protein [Solirubrobacteraceae bacterium]